MAEKDTEKPAPKRAAPKLPDDWRARHPRLTYPDETPAKHVARLRALAAEVPAKSERFLALADQIEGAEA